MTFIQWLDKISKDDVNLVGIKGARLGELYQEKLPVPFGFVITPSALKIFFESKDLKGKIDELIYELKIGNNEKIEEITKNVQKLILQSELPGVLKKEI